MLESNFIASVIVLRHLRVNTKTSVKTKTTYKSVNFVCFEWVQQI